MLAISLRILGILLMLFSFTMVPPLIIAEFAKDGSANIFLVAITATFFAGFLAWFPTQNKTRELRTRDGFLIVVLFWTTLCLFGSIPFLLVESNHISIAGAVFESISGLTTTGATILPNIDSLPTSILYYRQQLQLLGGMGIIVLAIAILPMLGIGGMQMFKAETSGPVKDNKLTPRITETAKALWYIYVGLTITCILSYWLLGMPIFDAVCYAFSTVSTGGFAPHSASMGYYNTNGIKSVTMFFMLAGSINFSLHFLVFKRFSLKQYLQDSELKVYIALIFTVICITFFVLLHFDTIHGYKEILMEASFQTVSLFSTTGYTTSHFAYWPNILPYLILFSGLLGGCSGSTSGGIKIIRLVLMFKQGMREIKRLIHPHGCFSLNIDKKAVPDKVIDAVWGFIGIYLILFGLFTMAFLACGLDFDSASSSTIASLANVGPALGKTAIHFQEVSETAKWIMCFAMLLGRLEIFTIIILFTPAFWRT